MSGEPIFARLAHEVGDWFHPHHSQGAPVSIIDVIKADLQAAGHTVDDAVHQVLSKHLGVANMAAYVANELVSLQATPWAQLGEKWAGVDPHLVSTGLRYADQIIHDLTGIAQQPPQAADGPAAP